MCWEATRTPEPWLREKKINKRSKQVIRSTFLFMNSYLNNGPGSKWYEDGPSNIVIQLDVIDPLLRNPRIFIGCSIIWSDGITKGWESLICMRLCSTVGGCCATQRAAYGKSHCLWIQRLTHVDLRQLKWINAAACVEKKGRACEQESADDDLHRC